MTLGKTLASLLVAVGLMAGGAIFGATDASAGWNNPDLLHVDSTFSDDDDSYNTAFITHWGAQNSADGTLYDVNNAGPVWLWWALYEPDKVTRSSKKGSNQQKSWVELGVYAYGSSTFYTSDIIDRCKGKTDVKADKNEVITQVTWDVNCKLDTTDWTSLTDSQAARLETLFTKKVFNAGSGKVKIKGKSKKNLGGA